MNLIKRLYREEEGQGLTEYALIIALVSIGVVAVMLLFKDKIIDVFTDINTELEKRPEAPAGT